MFTGQRAHPKVLTQCLLKPYSDDTLGLRAVTRLLSLENYNGFTRGDGVEEPRASAAFKQGRSNPPSWFIRSSSKCIRFLMYAHLPLDPGSFPGAPPWTVDAPRPRLWIPLALGHPEPHAQNPAGAPRSAQQGFGAPMEPKDLPEERPRSAQEWPNGRQEK